MLIKIDTKPKHFKQANSHFPLLILQSFAINSYSDNSIKFEFPGQLVAATHVGTDLVLQLNLVVFVQVSHHSQILRMQLSNPLPSQWLKLRL